MWDFSTQLISEDDLTDTQVIVSPPTEESYYEYEGIRIVFPYEAYESQCAMMEKIIKGVNNSENCLLESPTGTGKTAAILCALLAWQRAQEEKAKAYFSPKKFKLSLNDSDVNEPTTSVPPGDESKNIPIPTIYYATRTHSQIKQVVCQLKCTKYSNTPMTILASRLQTCLNQDALASQAGVNDTCDKLKLNILKNEKRREAAEKSGKKLDEEPLPTCSYYDSSSLLGEGPSWTSFPYEFIPARDMEVWDIEDLKSFGSSCQVCPYYGTKKLQEYAKIVFCTYNHLLDPQIMKSSKIELKGNILVFDEAHNIENLCRQVASIKLPLDSINNIINPALAHAMKAEEIPQIKSDPLKNLTIAFMKLRMWLEKDIQDDVNFKSVPNDNMNNPNQRKSVKTLSGDIVHISTNAGFGPDNLRGLWSDYFILEDKHYTISKNYPEAQFFKVDRLAMNLISEFLSCLNFLFKKENDEFIRLNDFEILLVKMKESSGNFGSSSKFTSNSISAIAENSKSKTDKCQIELQLICLNPAIAFQKMKRAKTVIVTSGTLSPTASFASELDTVFHHELSAKHVLGRDRVFAAIITKYATRGNDLNFSYRSLQTRFKNLHQDLSEIVFLICQQTHYGVLVFVPSSSFMVSMKSEWGRNGLLQRIMDLKDVYYENENRSAESFSNMMKNFKVSVEEPRGAVLFAVVRGRVSEGVDFKDNQARAVITIGIPFAPLKDESIVAKRQYNDRKKKEEPAKKYLSGQEWYNADAFRALNQAFGRCVRHSKDWGNIFIIDCRLSYGSNRKYLSRWVDQVLGDKSRRTVGSLESIFEDFVEFLHHHQNAEGTSMSLA